ncbi:MAG: aminotransferase class IV [Dehalococcoidales bacterium]|nr:MAG: aminotransferase class IV [Dehalococcoidales bacterium]
MSEIVYLNGSLVPREDARISVMDYGFLYGYGLFETMRAYGGRIFRLERHLERLAGSAAKLGIAVDKSVLESAVMDTIKANRLSEARIRLTVSIGEGGTVPDPASCGQPTVLVVVSHYQPLPQEVYEKGYRAIVSSVRRNSQSPLAAMKSLSYLESMLVRQEARAAGVDEAICLNGEGMLAEASTSNIFLVGDGALKTPSVSSGGLPGVTRETVLEIAGKLGITTMEDDITFKELIQAEEAFLTNSVIEIMPLVEIDGKPIGSGTPGEITRKLMAGYKEMVRGEVG